MQVGSQNMDDQTPGIHEAKEGLEMYDFVVCQITEMDLRFDHWCTMFEQVQTFNLRL
jgi:hypothetical protein